MTHDWNDLAVLAHETAEELVHAVAHALRRSALEAVTTRGRFVLALDRSPWTRAVCARLADDGDLRTLWSHTLVLEAHRPAADTDGEARTLTNAQCGALIGALGVPSMHVLLVPEGLPVQAAAAQYARTLRMALELRPAELPPIDAAVVVRDARGRIAGSTVSTATGDDASALVVARSRAPAGVMIAPAALWHAARVHGLFTTDAHAAATGRWWLHTAPSRSPGS